MMLCMQGRPACRISPSFISELLYAVGTGIQEGSLVKMPKVLVIKAGEENPLG